MSTQNTTSTPSLKSKAHALRHEWITNRNGDVCLRPMHFNSEGIREVRVFPDPCDFVPLTSAIAALEKLEAASLSIGDKITACLKSSGGTNLTITHVGFTSEVNGAEMTEGRKVKEMIGGQPVNTSLRVPTAIGRDKDGNLRAIHYWYGKWIGAYHRMLQFSREWETLDGQLLTPEMAALADKSLLRQ